MRCSGVALAALLGAANASALAAPEVRVAVVGRVIALDLSPSRCGGDYSCKDKEASWRMRLAVDTVVRGQPVPTEVVVRLRSPDAFEGQMALVIWTPAAEGEPVAVDNYRVDPLVGGGWAVCGDLLRSFHRVGPPLEDVALAPAFGNVSRLSPAWAQQKFPAELFRTEADGTVRCVRGWSIDTLVDYPAWTRR